MASVKKKRLGDKFWLFLLAVIAGLGLVVGLGYSRLRTHTFHGTVVQSLDVAPDFVLLNGDSGAVSLSDFRGKITLLFFGYTSCPDVCPATLAEIARAMKNLDQMAEQVQFLMISVDPERDTPQIVGDFARAFDPRFVGLSGTPQEIAAVAEKYGIYYAKAAGSQASGYMMEHTASLLVIDQRGYLKLIYSFGTPAEEIADDLAYLLR